MSPQISAQMAALNLDPALLIRLYTEFAHALPELEAIITDILALFTKTKTSMAASPATAFHGIGGLFGRWPNALPMLIEVLKVLLPLIVA